MTLPLGPGAPVFAGARQVGEIAVSQLKIGGGARFGMAILEAPYAHSGVDVYRTPAGPIRTLSPPFVANRSLFVRPQQHSYADRASIPFPDADPKA